MDNRLDIGSSKPSASSAYISVGIVIVGILISSLAGFVISGLGNTWQVFAGVAGIIVFLFVFSRPSAGAVLLVAVLYTQTYIIVGERYGVTDVVQGLIMLMVLCMGARWFLYTYEIPQGWMRPLLLVLFYCLVGLASVIYATDSTVAWYIALETIKSGIIALILAVVLQSEKSLQLVVWTLISAGLFLGSLSIFQFVTGSYYNDYGGYAIAALSNISGETNDYRLGGPVGDPNYFAQMMLVIVPLAMDRLWNERRGLLRFLAASALGVCAFTVLLTYSRGGFLSMLAIVIAMIAIFHRGQLRYVFAALVVGALLVNFLPAQFSKRISTLTELIPSSESATTSKDFSFRGRTSEMIVALQMFADHPILGVGLGNYQTLYQKYAQRLGMELRSEVRQAHSLYLEIASETGLLGLFSFGLLLWVIFKTIWRAQQVLASCGLVSLSNLVAAYAFSFLGYLLSATFIHAAYPRNFWVLAGIALAIPRMAEIEILNAKSTRV